jgi:hypothetical protein
MRILRSMIKSHDHPIDAGIVKQISVLLKASFRDAEEPKKMKIDAPLWDYTSSHYAALKTIYEAL